jgi:hypothetical protein
MEQRLTPSSTASRHSGHPDILRFPKPLNPQLRRCGNKAAANA